MARGRIATAVVVLLCLGAVAGCGPLHVKAPTYGYGTSYTQLGRD